LFAGVLIGADLPVPLVVVCRAFATGRWRVSGRLRRGRLVPGGQERLREAANAPRQPPPGMEVVAVRHLAEALAALDG
jgi:hypothetical protein